MPDNDFLRQTLTHYREQRQRILEQLRPVDLMIRHIETELGETPDTTFLPDFPQALSMDGNAERIPSLANNKRPGEVRGDEFFGLSQGEAARAYLRKVGHAAEIPELVAALNKGGCKVGGADPDRTLYIALIRNTKDFVKVPNGFIGLRAMYPGLKPGAALAGKPKEKKKPKRKKKRSTAGVKAKAKTQTPSDTVPVPEKPKVPVKATIREVLADGQFLKGETIVKRVVEKAPAARPFTIFGVLKNEKEFEKMNDEYRIKQ
jgi:hypothetical protein